MNINLTERKGWVFDLDGTLTRPVHDFALIRRELGIAAEDDILKTIAAQPASRRRVMTEKLDTLEHHFAAQAKPAKYAPDFLGRIKNSGCQLGILTRNSKALAVSTLKAIGLDHLFHPDCILGRDEASPKPAPDGILFLLNHWGLSSKEGVMVGDFHLDLLSGRAAGVLTVHVDERDKHWPTETDIRVNNLHELESLLTR